ncbi:L-threonylcarbamoyladenylate synthase [Poriferisphaera sp. WC338]|uniref:L-threonylcarbamoyladenylate synthase n=1 Tax=Poriferisphaera sp. WC338 TaxID=3425129 RepID=UPI003D814A5D
MICLATPDNVYDMTDTTPSNIHGGFEHEAIVAGADQIRAGKLVAFPTETVYGLGANAFDPAAVSQVFALKQRPSFDPLIVHVESVVQAKQIAASFPAHAEKLAEAFWPGPLTLVVHKSSDVPDIVTAGLPTVGLRLPNHAVARSLIEHAGTPIAAPSANKFGSVSPTSAQHVYDEFGDELGFILDGGSSETGVESTVVSVTTGKAVVLRLGGTSIEQIQRVLGEDQVSIAVKKPEAKGEHHEDYSKGLASPGMLSRHYAPRTPMQLVKSPASLVTSQLFAKAGLLALRKPEPRVAEKFEHVIVLSESGDLIEAASKLFESMRQLDRMRLDLIVAQPVPEIGLGRAINDRLRRAAMTH